MMVAGKYRSHQHLIGPLFMPIYLFALKMGLGVALVVTVIVAAVSAAVHDDVVLRFIEGLLAYPGRALMVFAWTTLGFAALDFAQSKVKLTHNWDPRTLPKLVRHEDRMSRANALCEFVATVRGDQLAAARAGETVLPDGTGSRTSRSRANLAPWSMCRYLP